MRVQGAGQKRLRSDEAGEQRTGTWNGFPAAVTAEPRFSESDENPGRHPSSYRQLRVMFDQQNTRQHILNAPSPKDIHMEQQMQPHEGIMEIGAHHSHQSL
ncbi:hypothetical protein VTN49DRAFT_5897 [Thermomyces lanuginosus]|uniref:uncharacterized protein n=1 Tax=Thermomyces lanuginosus TaxID=5541 RepID=UPI0037435E37